MGFERLAASVTLRRVHLKLLAHRRTDGAESTVDTISGVSPHLDAGGSYGLVATGIALRAAHGYDEIAAVLLVRGAEHVIDSRVSRP